MSQLRQPLLFFDKTGFRDRKVKAVTFKGNFDYPIHRWFRLTPSFSPELVRDILEHWSLSPTAKIFDPFCGVGTTPLVCQEKGFSSWAVELNPLLYFVSKVKTTPIRNPVLLKVVTEEIIERAQAHLTIFKNLNTEQFLAKYYDWIPKIHNLTRWWSPLTLKKLVALKMSLADLPLLVEMTNLFLLAIASILIEVSNARYNHPSLSFDKVVKHDAPVFERMVEQVEMMVSDLLAFSKERPKTLILQGNSKYLDKVLSAANKFDAVITSPPYPNRYSYARETRPQMFFLGLIQDSKEVNKIEMEAIGGTWGKATSVLNSPHNYQSDNVRKALRGIPEHIEQHNYLMKNYVIKYFNDMESHIKSLKPFLLEGSRLAYVIGNSKFYGIALPTDEILADIFKAHGFKIISIERMRKRNSRTGLYEAVVFIENL